MLLNSQKGSALVNAMMAAALSIIVAYTVMTTKSDQYKVVTSMNAPISAQIVKARVLSTLMSDKAINNTVACAASGTCQHPSGNATGTGLALYDDVGTGQLVLDTRYPNSGFAISGDACDTFDAVNGNDECPFRIELTGSIVNTPSIVVNISAKFMYKAKANWVVNSANYDFTYNSSTGGTNVDNVRNIKETCKAFGNGTIIGANLEADKASCSTFVFSTPCSGAGLEMGPLLPPQPPGVPNPNLPKCNTTITLAKSCPGGQKFMGFSGTGVPTCQ